MKILAIVNQKGGVGKTTTASNLGAALGILGKTVLVIDVDPQGNCSDTLGINSKMQENHLGTIIGLPKIKQEDVASCIQKTEFEGLFVLPSHVTLSDQADLLNVKVGHDLKLKKIVSEVKDLFDYIILDSPPNLGILFKNVLAASTDVIIPVVPDYFSISGLVDLLDTIEEIRDTYSPELKIMGVILTKYEARYNITKEIAYNLEKYLPGKMFETKIRNNNQVMYAQNNMMPVVCYNAKCNASIDYLKLAKEVSKQ